LIRIEHDEQQEIVIAWDLHTNALLGDVSYINFGDGTILVASLLIEEDARRRGIATTLLNFLESLFPKKLIVEVMLGNDPAIALYKKLGYKITSRHRFHSLIFMEKENKGRRRKKSKKA
jgi:ribosomal protein S18 acetylase RimI-like enzyme